MAFPYHYGLTPKSKNLGAVRLQILTPDEISSGAPNESDSNAIVRSEWSHGHKILMFL